MTQRWMMRIGATMALAALAACATPPPPPPPAPPPPVIVLPPPPPPMPRPTPPNQSAPDLIIPASDLNGRRLTPNVDLTPEQALWQFRIGLNVAALNCRGPDDQILIDNYSRFLSNNRRAIAAAERAVIAELARQTGTNGIAVRDSLSTRLYNYFAQPPVTAQFCPIAFNLAGLAAVEPTATILPFAAVRMGELDQPFVDFYNAYARFQADMILWQSLQPPVAPIMAAPVPASSYAPAPLAPGVAGPTGRR